MTRASTFDGIASLNRAWVGLLRANCLTLVERPGAVTGVSVSKGFAHGAEAERDAVIALARRMSEEYGLLTETSTQGHFLTIRFTKSRDEQASLGSPKVFFLVAWARALLRSRRELVRQETRAQEEQEKALAEVRS